MYAFLDYIFWETAIFILRMSLANEHPSFTRSYQQRYHLVKRKMHPSTVFSTFIASVVVFAQDGEGLGAKLSWNATCATGFRDIKDSIDEAIQDSFTDVLADTEIPVPFLAPWWSDNAEVNNGHNGRVRLQVMMWDCNNQMECSPNLACAIYCQLRRRTLSEDEIPAEHVQGNTFQRQLKRRKRRNLKGIGGKSGTSGKSGTKPTKSGKRKGQGQGQLSAITDTIVERDNVLEYPEVIANPRQVDTPSIESNDTTDGYPGDPSLGVQLKNMISEKLLAVEQSDVCHSNPTCRCGFDSLTISIDQTWMYFVKSTVTGPP